ncbi:MAG: sensor histidine kinase [Candidatus Sumerlaeia bacterium]
MRYQISFRTQMLLVFLLCLGLLGAGMIFLNAYLIAGLKERMKDQAIYLAEEQGRKAANRILAMLDEEGTGELIESKNVHEMAQQVEIVLRGNDNVMAVCVMDSYGNIVMSDTGESAELRELTKDDEGVEAVFDPKNFNSLRVRLRKKHPNLRTVQVPINKGSHALGNVMFLVSESKVYQDLEMAASEITRRLFSVLFAFIGVLSLGLYLTTRLYRRQMRLRAENEKLDRMAYVGTLAAGLAHEIRNPLNAMSVNLSVAQEEMETGEEGSKEIVGKAIGLIHRETKRLNKSLNSFLQFARPDSQQREDMELAPLVEEILDLLSRQIEEAKIEVEKDLPEETHIQADFSGLRQVVYNIVLNAIQAMADNPPGKNRVLRIGARRESAQWFLWIEDTGPGIQAGTEKKIFDVFHSTKSAGSGFGLSIAKSIIDSHGGDIRAMRREEGGTRVEITLPET